MIWISQHRKIDSGVLRFVNVLEPQGVRVERVNADGQHLDVAARERILEFGGYAQLGRTNWREVFRMREQQAPTGAEPGVKINVASRRFLNKIGCDDGNTISAKVAAGDGAAGDGNTIVDIDTSKTDGTAVVLCCSWQMLIEVALCSAQ